MAHDHIESHMRDAGMFDLLSVDLLAAEVQERKNQERSQILEDKYEPPTDLNSQIFEYDRSAVHDAILLKSAAHKHGSSCFFEREPLAFRIVVRCNTVDITDVKHVRYTLVTRK